MVSHILCFPIECRVRKNDLLQDRIARKQVGRDDTIVVQQGQKLCLCWSEGQERSQQAAAVSHQTIAPLAQGFTGWD